MTETPPMPSPLIVRRDATVVVSVQSTFDDINVILNASKDALTRKGYMDLLVRINDETQTRLDKCNEEIGAEMHERRDDD